MYIIIIVTFGQCVNNIGEVLGVAPLINLLWPLGKACAGMCAMQLVESPNICSDTLQHVRKPSQEYRYVTFDLIQLCSVFVCDKAISAVSVYNFASLLNIGVPVRVSYYLV